LKIAIQRLNSKESKTKLKTKHTQTSANYNLHKLKSEL